VAFTLPGEKFRHNTVPAGEFTLDYTEAGPADAAVTIVSFPGSAGLEMSTAKDILAEKYRVIEINPPGWAGKDDLNRPIGMTEIGELLGEAANSLVPGRYYVIGTSMGGASAVHAAVKYPDRVIGIIAEGGMVPALPSDLRNPPPSEEDRAAAAAADPDEHPAYPLPPFDQRKPWATEDYVRKQMENRFKMFQWTSLDMLPDAALTALREQGTPVLFVLGTEDEILAPSQQKTVATYLPDADFRTSPGKHDIQNTGPEGFVALVDEFIARTSADVS
jgi:pimeloyl-ACP methyl ester carboxylesterase